MSGFDQLERQLRGAVRDRAVDLSAGRPTGRRGRDHNKLVGSVLAGVLLAAGGGTAIAISAPDARTPQGEPRVDAKVDRAQGPPLGIASYRSQEGKRCFAEGRVVDGELVVFAPGGGFAPNPLDETGMCVVAGAPLALAMGDHPDDSSRVIVSGLATPGAKQVQVRSPTGQAITQPHADGAFMVSVPAPLDSDVQVSVTEPDGSVTTKTLTRLRPPPPLPDAPRAPRAHPSATATNSPTRQPLKARVLATAPWRGESPPIPQA